ncbi:MAG: SpoIIE family protein phosphatase [Planctomycetia bacterium]|nr:SpoIIE family protein phosphatase [Planctomycetia bacterium]
MSAHSPTLLVVDDNELNREVLTRRLQRRGYDVLAAHDGQAALALLAEQRFDLILLDILMPGISGIDLLRRIRQIHAPTEVPVIMVTAVDESAQVVEALNLGANDYITKPLDFAVVLARVQTQLGAKAAVDRIRQLERNVQLHNEDLAQTNRWLEQANAELADANRRMRADLLLAAQVQNSLLPRVLPEFPQARLACRFQACSELAGDLFNVVQLDRRHVGLYVLDVVGHGAAAALLAVMASRVLNRLLPAWDPESGERPPVVLRPADLAAQLSREFPHNPDTDQYFTILYALLDLETLKLTFVSAGHPWPIVLRRTGEIQRFDAPGPAIGWDLTHYRDTTVQLERGDRLLLYTDGLTEAIDADKEMYGSERVMASLVGNRQRPLQDNVEALYRAVQAWSGTAGLRDDLTILYCEVGEPQPLLSAPAAAPSVHEMRTLTDVPAADTAVAGLRTQVGAAPPARTETRPLAPPPPASAGTASMPDASYSFLSPPQAAGELGRLGPYRVLRLLGTGGMAVVFQAEDTQLLRRVALKVLKPDLAANASFRERFLREARAVGAIQHDRIVTVYQVGQEAGVPFFAMQLLQGESLESRLRRDGCLPSSEVVRLGREIAEGLEAAHMQDLIHRDVKPDNIWLEARPHEPARVKLLDFGLVRQQGGAPHLTQVGLVLGTPTYMSPEQARGRVLDARSDLFSLGIVLYRMCVGELPFDGSDTLATLAALAMDEPRSIAELNPRVPSAVVALVERLLAKRKEDRPANARAVIEALRAIEIETPVTTP